MTTLDKLGKLLIEQVRDETLDDYLMIKEGRMKSAETEALYAKIQAVGTENINVLDEVTVHIVDRLLHNLLVAMEETEEIALVAKDAISPNVDLAEQSDGLAGELYSNESWIKRFSEMNL